MLNTNIQMKKMFDVKLSAMQDLSLAIPARLAFMMQQVIVWSFLLNQVAPTESF